jgi:stress-induced morphogen
VPDQNDLLGLSHPRKHPSPHQASSYDRRVSTQPLRLLLESAFPDATELDVIDRTGGGDHFQVVVTSPSLLGLSLVEQHRRVYEALSAPLADGTNHELRIKTKGAT